ncbi:MAG: CpsD/CapB family tyrosine-protein kinase [Terriglobales bacterium]
MGLFYTALERAENAKPREAGTAAEGPVPVTDWKDAQQRDVAGFPLAATEILEPEPAAAAHPSVGLDGSVLALAPTDGGIAKEQFRILRTRIVEALGAQRRRSLLITSAGPGEGKTMVAANLALQLSSLREARVLLIDADLRRAGLSAGLNPAPKAGLGNYLKGEVELEGLLRDVDPWLTVLPTLTLHEEAAELLASQRMVELLELARARFDLVLLDGAPVGPVADSRVLARLTGASLLVVRAGITPIAEVELAAAVLHPCLLGSVLNGAALRSKGRYGYGYGYGPNGAGAGTAA